METVAGSKWSERWGGAAGIAFVSLFFASGIFGLSMYFSGAISIYGFKKLLPVDAAEIEGLKPGQAAAAEPAAAEAGDG